MTKAPTTSAASIHKPALWWAGVGVLLVVLASELFVPAQRQSQTPDEANHMLGGVRYWKYLDFGANPEHPPLAKFVATWPLLNVPFAPPAPFNIMFKMENFGDGITFLYTHDADAMLLHARLAVSVFSFALALLVLAAATEMFGPTAGLIALTLFVFEPTLAAHGSIVATDMAVSCCYFATIYAFYRWTKRPTTPRLLLCGLAAGLALASKHSAIFLAPVLTLLALTELLTSQTETNLTDTNLAKTHIEARGKKALRLAGALLAIAAIGYVILWAFYGFRYNARPGGLAMSPSLADYTAATQTGWVMAVIPHLAAWHLLPEAYLFGLVDIVVAETRDPMFLLGKDYATGHWFYFPVAFLIKSTLGFLLLLAVAPFLKAPRTRHRELLFLLLPALGYFAFSLTSTMNIGIRHILPVYPLLVVVAAASAAALATKQQRWGKYAAAALVLAHVVSSALVFPNYLTYANEAWGGPTNTYHLLTDSNVDWNQSLKDIKLYLDRNQIHDCWFAHYGWDVDPAYYHIPCRPLPEGLSHKFGQPLPPTPSSIDGTILISATEANGDYWGPGDINPYMQFLHLRPDAMIANSILVFHGRFDVPVLSALAHLSAANQLATQHQLAAALTEAQTAVTFAPKSAEAQAVLGNILTQLGQPNEARRAYQTAVALANADNPDFQFERVLNLPSEFTPK
ncbi:MAG TPA: glycosyltransferase family 39 protein [Acidisarcina sp.]